jgi:phosphate:Na+ symporter
MMLGGIGLLLYGMKMLSGGLETLAGDGLHTILRKATSNRFLAVLVGIGVTIAINSSTAATIMTVGFVNSGFLTLTQAVGVIMGANVGTTFSTQLIALGMTSVSLVSVASGFIFVGAAMYVFFRKAYVRNIGFAVLGFGIMFFGVAFMSDAMRPLRGDEGFQAFLVGFNNPWLALLAGFVITAIIQSSTATTAILVTLLAGGVVIPFQTSAFILLGVNIGTSLTTVISSIPASRESKRAALFHILYDIIGSAVFGTLIWVFPGILRFFTDTWSNSPAQQAAMFHTAYNVATMLLLLPFIKYIVMLMKKIVPTTVQDTGVIHERKLLYINNQRRTTLTLSIMNAHSELCRMGQIAHENLRNALDIFFNKDLEKVQAILDNEDTVDYLHQAITTQLAVITNLPHSAADAKRIGDMFVIASDMEQISDYAKNIAEYTLKVDRDGLLFSNIAVAEMVDMADAAAALAECALNAFKDNSKESVPFIKKEKKRITKLASRYAKNHFKRLKTKECRPKSGVVYMDIINDLEKSAANAEKIIVTIS